MTADDKVFPILKSPAAQAVLLLLTLLLFCLIAGSTEQGTVLQETFFRESCTRWIIKQSLQVTVQSLPTIRSLDCSNFKENNLYIDHF